MVFCGSTDTPGTPKLREVTFTKVTFWQSCSTIKHYFWAIGMHGGICVNFFKVPKEVSRCVALHSLNTKGKKIGYLPVPACFCQYHGPVTLTETRNVKNVSVYTPLFTLICAETPIAKSSKLSPANHTCLDTI